MNLQGLILGIIAILLVLTIGINVIKNQKIN